MKIPGQRKSMQKRDLWGQWEEFGKKKNAIKKKVSGTEKKSAATKLRKGLKNAA